MERVFIGLGSNLGDRKKNIENSVDLLVGTKKTNLLKRASYYETEPIGPNQPWFINTAIKVETSLSPEGLLDSCKEVERRIGRFDTSHWGPRLVDLDLLLFGDRVLNNGRLEIPHPQMEKREFVLRPLIELEPELIHPELDFPLKGLLTKTEEDKKVIKL